MTLHWPSKKPKLPGKLNMKGSVLVFGANGFVGPYLVNEFIKSGYAVIGSDRASRSQICGLEGYMGADILDAERVKTVIHEANPQMIVNLAAISSVGQSWKMPQQTMEVNVVGALNILEAVKGLNVKPKVLLIGSSEEYAPSPEPLTEDSPIDAVNPYGVSKLAQEKLVDIYATEYEIPIYRVRAFNHTGVGQPSTFVLPHWCQQVAAIKETGKPEIMKVGNLEVVRDFSDVRDIARGYRLLLESNLSNAVFNIGSGRGWPLSDLLEIIISFAGKPIEVQVDPELLRPSDNPVVICDNTKLNNLLGWTPVYPMEQTLSEMFESFLIA